MDRQFSTTWLQALPVNVRAIPVAYADWQAAGSPAVPAVLDAANLYGWSTVLVDTFDKAESGSLLDLCFC